MIDESPASDDGLDLAECIAAIYEIVEKTVQIAEDAEGIWLSAQ